MEFIGGDHWTNLHWYARALIAAAAAFGITLVIGYPIIRVLRAIKAGQPIRELGPASHKTKEGTPTMGGILFVAGSMVAIGLFADLSSLWVRLALIAYLGFAAIGFLDDYIKLSRKHNSGLPAWAKLLAQIAVGALIGVYLFDSVAGSETGWIWIFPLIDSLVALPWAWLVIPWAVLVLAATTNAVNFSDGIDGLATSMTLPALLGLAFIAGVLMVFDLGTGASVSVSRAEELVVVLASVGGALGAFWWFNAFPARVFMGDMGSLAIGGLLGSVALILRHEWFLLVLVGVMVAEVVSVVLQVAVFKATKGKRLFRMSPLHHHYELGGMHENQVTVRFTLVSWLLLGLTIVLLVTWG